jgi:hypothetical protein
MTLVSKPTYARFKMKLKRIKTGKPTINKYQVMLGFPSAVRRVVIGAMPIGVDEDPLQKRYDHALMKLYPKVLYNGYIQTVERKTTIKIADPSAINTFLVMFPFNSPAMYAEKLNPQKAKIAYPIIAAIAGKLI